MFFQELKLDSDESLRLLATDNAGYDKYVQNYYTRKFYIGDTGINRKTLKDWEASELLPYAYKEEGWRKFSFTEWVWLECINEFRKLGVSIEKINSIKKTCFDIDPEEWYPQFQNALETFPGQIDNKDVILSSYKNPDVTKEMRKQMVEELQMSPFLLFLLTVVVTDQNICIVYNNNDFCSILVLESTDDNIRKYNHEDFTNLINDSFVVLNLRKVVNRIFQKTEHRKESFVIDFLSPKEKKIFDHIRFSNAKEITITFDKNSEPTHIKVKRNRISKETLNKVARFLKSGKYQKVEFITRDGQIIKYEEQDSIRLE